MRYPLSIMRPQEIETVGQSLQNFSGVGIDNPVETIRVPTQHRADAMIVDPFKLLKVQADPRIRLSKAAHR